MSTISYSFDHEFIRVLLQIEGRSAHKFFIVHPYASASRYPVKVLSFIRRPITSSPPVLPSLDRVSFMYISSVMSRVIYGFDSFGMIPNGTARIPDDI